MEKTGYEPALLEAESWTKGSKQVEVESLARTHPQAGLLQPPSPRRLGLSAKYWVTKAVARRPAEKRCGPGTAASTLECAARGIQQVSPWPGWWDRAWAPTATSASARAVWSPPPVRDPQGTSPFFPLGGGEPPHSGQLQPLRIGIAAHSSRGPQLHLDAYFPFPRWGNRGTWFLGTGGACEGEDFLARSTRCSLSGSY